MSCLPEYRYSIYLDGELEGDALREVEAHLVTCRRCRGLVVALQEEIELLGDVLQEREVVSASPVPDRARAKGLAIGLAPALGVAALIVTISGWLIELELPAGAGWLSPLKFIGAYEMLFDTVFMLRDRAPEMFDVLVAVGVLTGTAAMATFLAGAALRRLSRQLAPVLVLFALLGTLGQAGTASALVVWHDAEDVRVGPGETLDETLVTSADSVTIEGTIEGDLVVLAERFVLTGRVAGNVYAAAREVELAGEVEGAAHLGGERVVVEGRVARTLYGAAESLTLREGGTVGWDAALFGERLHLDGSIGRDLDAFGEQVEIRGAVKRNVTTRSDRLVVHDRARIGGDLDLEVGEEGPEIASGAVIGGETRAGELSHPMQHLGSRWADPGFYVRGFVFLVSAFLVGMALYLLLPGLFAADLETSTEFFRCMGYGFVALVMTPIFLVLCLVTVVGIPIGVIGFFVYVTTLFVSVIVVSSLIGGALMGRAGDSSYAFGASLLLGLVVVLVATNLPWVGALLRILALLTGLGLLLTSTYETWQRGRAGRYA